MALLPLVIVVVSLLFQDGTDAITNSIGDRFGLDAVARKSIRLLFTSSGVAVTVSWLAVAITLLSAFSLSRRLARVYASIFSVPPLARSQTWRGIVWVALQLVLFISGSFLRDARQGSGIVVTVVATLGLQFLWFVADIAGIRLLVPRVRMPLVVASGAVSTVGRFGLAIWASIYMPNALTSQASQYGPIGVTFALFTYILAGVLVYLCAPLIVTTWVAWRDGRRQAEPVISD